jgi:hypothetical protein
MALDELVETLLYEGYALYPYTPDATKNTTPTPFGILYPPTYAADCDGARDHARLECRAIGGSSFTATLKWLAAGRQEHSVTLGPIAPGGRTTSLIDGARFTLRADPDSGVVRCCAHNTVGVEHGLDRAGALQRSMISLHFIIHVDGGRFVSPLEDGCESVNTWPVLASDADDTILGATIVLPDHPQVAPSSFGNLFDNTEIEEALVLHVHSLTDAERAAITDPKVREMLERTLALGPEQLAGLHTGLGEVDNNPGEARVTVDGVTFVKGAKVRLMPGTTGSVHDRMLDGRIATLERIYVDVDDRVHFGVTIDEDPGQLLLRETGRYLFFFPGEVQPL